MKEGIALTMFFAVAIAGIALLVYPVISGSITYSPCAPAPATTTAQPPVTYKAPTVVTAKPAAPKRLVRPGDRSFYVDESGIIQSNPCPPSAPTASPPITG
jgi:hypothetical protein